MKVKIEIEIELYDEYDEQKLDQLKADLYDEWEDKGNIIHLSVEEIKDNA